MNKKKLIFFIFLFPILTSNVVQKQTVFNDFNQFKKEIQNSYIYDHKIKTNNSSISNFDREFYLSFNPNEPLNSQIPLYKKGFIDQAVLINNEKNTLTFNGELSPFFYSNNSKKDFTMSIYIYPFITNGYHTILKRIGIINRDSDIFKEGFSIFLKDDHPFISFYNLFKFKDKRTNITLKSNTSIRPNQWYKITVIFDSYNGLLKLYLNQNLVDIKQTTMNKNLGNIYYPSFSTNNKSSLNIGGDSQSTTYVGLIDEFEIYPFQSPIIYANPYPNIKSEYISKIYYISTNKILTNMEIVGKNIDYNRTFLYYKLSKTVFKELSSNNNSWIYLEPQKKINGNIIQEKDFKSYLQFKIVFQNKISGQPAIINGLKLTYNEILLFPPENISLSNGKEKTLTVSWKPVNNININKYYIYYSKDYFINDVNEIIFNSNIEDTIGLTSSSLNFDINNLELDNNYEVYIVSAGINNIKSSPSKKYRFYLSQ